MLLKDVIQIPTALGSEQFVLRLTEGITPEQAQRTLDEYVVTNQIAQNLDQALGILQGALGLSVGADEKLIEGPHQQGRAVYLHGSFGSGKSHFMAVLHQLLAGNPRALGRPELAGVVTKYRSWLGKKKLLLVAYHMLGAESLEARVFEDYCRQVERQHPGCEPPALFDADALIADAESMRQRLGDGTFFGMLGDAQAEKGWGKEATVWDPERYRSALAAKSGTPVREDLALALRERLFPGSTRDLGTVRFDVGLERISQHAQALGYDGIVLFLDELILWLASKAATPGFLGEQIDRIVNLVEAQRLERPIPIVSFIARQRDLRELIGADHDGAQQLAIDDKLKFHEGRFKTIPLSTTDLPEIASRRLLTPRGPAGRQALADAFAEVERMLSGSGGSAYREALLGKDYTLADFRKVYPFSPALVDTLVEAASMLQRDRTALRAMLELLVQHREHLEVGELIPVGDLYDVIKSGHDAITPAFEEKFARAQRFYDQKLVPLLEAAHKARRHEVLALPWNDPRHKKWRTDERILKTVLLSHLVPNVPALQHLTAQRIAALNHGSIHTLIPGQEAQEVLRRLKTWNAEVPELQLTGEGANPQIGLVLHGVDIEGILKNAAGDDNHGNRVALLKELVYTELDVPRGQLEDRVELTWRGTKRSARILFRNIADMPLSALENEGPDWQLVIDYPIDDNPAGASRDDQQIAKFRERGKSTQTLLWRPTFLNQRARDELGKLVRLERVLRSDQSFEQHTSHLSTEERQQAKPLLENQRRTLREKFLGTLRAAYGLSNDPSARAGLEDGGSQEERFVSLDEGFSPQPPATGQFRDGLAALLAQALEHQFPKAPHWERHFGGADVRRALEIALKAASRQPHRAELDTAQAKLMREFAPPLDLGQCGSAFVLGNVWLDHFNRKIAQSGDSVATVRDLRRWTEEPEPRGLPREVQDLLVIVFAAQGERAIYRGGSSLDEGNVRIGGLQPDDELRKIPLPSSEAWQRALQRAGAIFGVTNPDLFCNGSNVASLAKRVLELVGMHRSLAQELRSRLHEYTPIEIQPRSKRLKDADAVLDLLERLDVESPKELIERLANAKIEGDVTPESMAASMKQAKPVIEALQRMNWKLLEGLTKLTGSGPRGQAAQRLLDRLAEGLTASQLAVELPAVLREVEAKATELLIDSGAQPPPNPPPPPTVQPDREQEPPGLPPQPGAAAGAVVVRSRQDLDELGRRLAHELARPGTELDVTWVRRGGEA